MNWRAVWAIVRKDVRLVVQNGRVLWAMLLLPLIILVVMPGLMTYLASTSEGVNDFQDDFGLFLQNMPPGLRTELGQYDTTEEQLTLLISGYLFAPLFLMVPLMVSTMIGADSIAGEHERKTLEGLLYTPITDFELYVGKLLTAWLPALAITLLGAVVNVIVVNLAGWNVMGRVFFPNLTWLLIVMWMSPAVAALGLAALIVVSSRAKTVQESMQVGGLIILPIIAVIIAQITGVVYLSPEVVVIAGVVVWIISLVVLRVGTRFFQRGELIARL